MTGPDLQPAGADDLPAQAATAVSGEPFRCGTVAIVGRPNVGKSTLLNHIIGQKVSITSAKPQTTRHRIVGVLTRPDAQLLMLDTPGYQGKHRDALNRVLNRTVIQSAEAADVVVMVSAGQAWSDADHRIARAIPKGRPAILAINKMDLVERKDAMLPVVDRIRAEHPFIAFVPICARNGRGVDELITECIRHLPIGPAQYDVDTVTDRSERFFAAELIREKLFRLVGDEVPYTSTVVIDKFEEMPRLRRIYATILVERDSHAGIVLGNGGEKIKRIGSEARIELERIYDAKVHLELWVKTKSGWADNEQSLRAYGYD